MSRNLTSDKVCLFSLLKSGILSWIDVSTGKDLLHKSDDLNHSHRAKTEAVHSNKSTFDAIMPLGDGRQRQNYWKLINSKQQ